MTSHMQDKDMDHFEFECIDAELGDQLWRRDDPDCPAELRRRLDLHHAHCAACRLQVAVQERTAAGLRDGRLKLAAPASGRLPVWLGTFGGTALAAGLALVLLLPPRAPHEDLVLRGAADGMPAIERPVPGEVVRGGRPTLRWTPLDGASRYEVQVTMAEGDYSWSASTDQAEARVPAGMDLPRDARFRVSVAPVPAHLAPDGAMRTSFRTGDTAAWLGYRLRRGATPGRAAGLVGALSLLLAVGVAVVRQRSG